MIASAANSSAQRPTLGRHSTGKERDVETGMDFFLARYFSGPQGRFSSPDEALLYADPDNPQSWNLYEYGLNSPLVYTDPDGHEEKDPCEKDPDHCVVVTADKPLDPAGVEQGRFLKDSAKKLKRLTESAKEAVVDWILQPRDPGCMAGSAAVGATAGGFAGGAGGLIGLAGGPTVVITVPSFSAGGAAAGGGVGTGLGFIMCSKGGGGGSKFGSNQRQNKMAKDARNQAERNTGKKFTPALERKFHDEITGQGISDYHKLVQIAEDVLGGRI
jgi:RHS repeat-associated protein